MAKGLELKKWGSLNCQGKCVTACSDDPIGNSWLYRPTLLKPSRFITALRLRTDQGGTRVAMSRGIPQRDIKCRKCREVPETLGHVLGQCSITKSARIRRHDEIVDFVAKEIQHSDPGATVTKEPRLFQEGNLLKPDLVVTNRKGVFVVDVTVRHEDIDYLEVGAKDKVRKYSPLFPQLALGREGAVLPLVVGTRGAMPKSTIKSMKLLGSGTKHRFTTMSLIALRCSIEIYHNFIDYDDAPRVRRNSEPPDPTRQLGNE